MNMKPTALLLLFLPAVVSGQSERSLVRDGNRQYNQSKFADAEVSYRKALDKDRDLRQGAFNLGDALYKQGRYSEAAEQYGNAAAKAGDDALKAKAYHNLGNALLKEKKIPESIAAYKEALKASPKDADTKYNLEYAKALLKQQQQQQQQKQQNKNDKKDQQKQDQQKQDQQKKDQQKQDQQKQDQQQQQKDQQRDAQQKKQQISKQDAERILEALKNEEKDVQKKLHKKVPARVHVEKDW